MAERTITGEIVRCGCGHPIDCHDQETGWCRVCEDDHASNPDWFHGRLVRSLFADLLDSAFGRLSDHEIRVALFEAAGILDDHDLMHLFACRAEEAIIEGRGQAMEP